MAEALRIDEIEGNEDWIKLRPDVDVDGSLIYPERKPVLSEGSEESGFHGHAGREGERGGSLPGEGTNTEKAAKNRARVAAFRAKKKAEAEKAGGKGTEQARLVSVLKARQAQAERADAEKKAAQEAAAKQVAEEAARQAAAAAAKAAAAAAKKAEAAAKRAAAAEAKKAKATLPSGSELRAQILGGSDRSKAIADLGEKKFAIAQEIRQFDRDYKNGKISAEECTKRMDEASRRYNRVQDESNKLMAKASAGREVLKVTERTVKDLTGKEAKIYKVDPISKQGQAEAAQAILDEVATWVSPDQLPKSGAELTVGTKRAGEKLATRAWYRSEAHLIELSQMGTKLTDAVNARILAHEFGHHLEETMPGWRKAANDFLSSRVVGEKPTKMGAGYDKDEIAYEDKFRDHYVGKVYPAGHTEVLSMGVQYLYESPTKFAKSDPGYFDFMVNLLHGVK